MWTQVHLGIQIEGAGIHESSIDTDFLECSCRHRGADRGAASTLGHLDPVDGNNSPDIRWGGRRRFPTENFFSDDRGEQIVVLLRPVVPGVSLDAAAEQLMLCNDIE